MLQFLEKHGEKVSSLKRNLLNVTVDRRISFNILQLIWRNEMRFFSTIKYASWKKKKKERQTCTSFTYFILLFMLRPVNFLLQNKDEVSSYIILYTSKSNASKHLTSLNDENSHEFYFYVLWQKIPSRHLIILEPASHDSWDMYKSNCNSLCVLDKESKYMNKG